MNVALDVIGWRVLDLADQRFDRSAGFVALGGGRLPKLHDFIKLIDCGVRGGVDFFQRLGELVGCIFAEPEIRVFDVAGFFNEVEVESCVGIFFS